MNLRNNNDNAQPKSVKSAKSVVENTFESKKENRTMKKKEYMTPETVVETVVLQQMIAFSGGDQTNDVVIDPTPDNSSTDQMSRELDVFFE